GRFPVLAKTSRNLRMNMSSRKARARWIVLIAVVFTVVSYQVPHGYYVVYPMMLLSTYAHEMGHGLAAMLTGGSFESFVMYADGSGAALTRTSSGLARAITAAGGLVGPALLGAVMFVAASRARFARAVLTGFAALVTISLILVVRNGFGWIFLGVVVAVVFFVARRGSALAAQTVLAFIAAQMSASVFARSDYLFTATARTAQGPMPSDVAQIAEVLLLPYWVWGAVCGAFSVAVLIVGLTVFWKQTAPPEPRTPQTKGP
ncbi:MAG: M50 family metallopeptidase, partial [Myxococcota bacterium]